MLVDFDLPGQPAKVSAFAVRGQLPARIAAAGDRLDEHARLVQRADTQTLVLPSTSSANVDRSFDLYVYDSTNDATTN